MNFLFQPQIVLSQRRWHDFFMGQALSLDEHVNGLARSFFLPADCVMTSVGDGFSCTHGSSTMTLLTSVLASHP